MNAVEFFLHSPDPRAARAALARQNLAGPVALALHWHENDRAVVGGLTREEKAILRMAYAPLSAEELSALKAEEARVGRALDIFYVWFAPLAPGIYRDRVSGELVYTEPPA